MKLSVHCLLLIAVAAGLVFTFGEVSNSLEEQTPGIGPISEPHPITLRSCAKEVIARAIIDDEMSLTDAAALFGEVYRLIPDPPGLDFTFDAPAAVGPPPADEERLCRRVIDWLKYRNPGAEVMARLDAAYREWRREGTGHLPDPAGLVPSSTELLKQARAVWLVARLGKQRGRTPAAAGARD